MKPSRLEMKKNYNRYFCLFFMLVLFGCIENNPILEIEGGKIQGVLTDKDGVYAYKGIPYAAPPVGDLRWREPQPVVPWDSILVCDEFGHPSYQSVH